MSVRQQQGIAPIVLIIIICFGFFSFLLFKNYSKFNLNIWKQAPSQTSSPSGTPAATQQKLSLKELCIAEINSVPKLPFRYQSEDKATGTLRPTFKKERFEGAKNTASCYIGFMFNRVIEQAYADMGIQYYEKGLNGTKFIKPGAPEAFEKAVDNAFDASLKKAGWNRITQYGEKSKLLPVILLSKQKDGKEYFLEVTHSGYSGVATSYIITVVEK
ncbi:hypothetical protein HYW42_03890 [Candidatus Daviesbacteria bacterium]|nr:hypothetical protein [Candidatus Daviesbacteria bacterium]